MRDENDLAGSVEETTCAVNVYSVPKDLRDKFRSWCVARHYSMNRAVVALIRRAIGENLTLNDAGDRRFDNKGKSRD